jgi:hypothetical protein
MLSFLDWVDLVLYVDGLFLFLLSHVTPFSMQVFILFSDGSIFVICPVVPFGR